jgi:hypothetical protein
LSASKDKTNACCIAGVELNFMQRRLQLDKGAGKKYTEACAYLGFSQVLAQIIVDKAEPSGSRTGQL